MMSAHRIPTHVTKMRTAPTLLAHTRVNVEVVILGMVKYAQVTHDRFCETYIYLSPILLTFNSIFNFYCSTVFQSFSKKYLGK